MNLFFRKNDKNGGGNCEIGEQMQPRFAMSPENVEEHKGDHEISKLKKALRNQNQNGTEPKWQLE